MKICIILLSLTCLFANGQDYQHAIEKCTSELMAGIKNPPVETEVVEKLKAFGSCVKGVKIPDFEVVTLTNRTISTESLKGNVVLINFWFTTCAPCILEIPALNELHNELINENFILLSFATNDIVTLEEFIKKRKVDFEIVPESKKIIQETFMSGLGFPTNMIVNKQGQIVAYKVGGGTNEADAQKGIDELREIIKTELKK